MKLKIVREGTEPEFGRVFAPRSLIWDEDLPIVWSFDHTAVRNLIGKVSGLERQDDGWITLDTDWAVIRSEWTEHLFETVDGTPKFRSNLYSLSIYANEVTDEKIVTDADKDRYYKLVTSARIRSVSIIPNAAHPRLTNNLEYK